MPIIYDLPQGSQPLGAGLTQAVHDVINKQLEQSRYMANEAKQRSAGISDAWSSGVKNIAQARISADQEQRKNQQQLAEEQWQWDRTEASQAQQSFNRLQEDTEKMFSDRIQQGYGIDPKNQPKLDQIEEDRRQLEIKRQQGIIRPAQYYQAQADLVKRARVYMPSVFVQQPKDMAAQFTISSDPKTGITKMWDPSTQKVYHVADESKSSQYNRDEAEKERIGKLQVARATFKSNHIKEMLSAGLSYEEAKQSAEDEARQTFPDLYPQQVAPDGQPIEATTPELTLPPAAPPVFRVTKQDKQDIRRRTDAVQGLTPSEKTDLYYQELDNFKKSGQQINDREYAAKYGDFRTPDVPTEQTALPSESIQSQEIDVSKLGPAEAAILRAKRKAALAVVMKNPDMKEKSPEEIGSEVNRQVNIEEIALGRKPYKFGTQAEPTITKSTVDTARTEKASVQTKIDKWNEYEKSTIWLDKKPEKPTAKDLDRYNKADEIIQAYERQQSGVPAPAPAGGAVSPKTQQTAQKIDELSATKAQSGDELSVIALQVVKKLGMIGYANLSEEQKRDFQIARKYLRSQGLDLNSMKP